jgi:hypothetical protein
VRIVRKDQNVPKGSYSDLHVYEATCVQVGSTKVTFVVGNNPSATNRSISLYVSLSMCLDISLYLYV